MRTARPLIPRDSLQELLRICLVVGLVHLSVNSQQAIGEETSTTAAATGRLSGRIQVVGSLPKLSPLAVRPRVASRSGTLAFDPNGDQRVLKVPNESLLVSPEGGLANAVIYLKSPPVGYVAGPVPTDPIIVTNEPLRFSPRIAVMRAGQPLLFKNADKEPTNFHLDCARNNAVNMLVQADDSIRVRDNQILLAESVPMTIRSDIQPWKSWARLLPLAHPFAAVSDAEGRFEITGLPVGSHDFIVWHELTGYLDKKLGVVANENVTTNLNLKFDVERFKPETLNEGRATKWESNEGLTTGVSWTSGETEYTAHTSKPGPQFQYLLRNLTEKPVNVPIPETLNWDMGIQSVRQLSVRIHDRGESMVTLAPKETKILNVSNSVLDVSDLESGYWQVHFSTPINGADFNLDLWLESQDPKWTVTRSIDAEKAADHRDSKFKDVRWGPAVQGLRLGARMKCDPDDSLLRDARRKGRLRVVWPDSNVVTLSPEYFLWNTTSAEVEISMLHHVASDWGHRLRRTDGYDISPLAEIGGPKFEERHRLAAGDVLSLGTSSFKISRPDSEIEADVELPPNVCGYWTFLNLHRMDQPLLNLHLTSGFQELIDSQAVEAKRRQ